MQAQINRVEAALAELKQGKMIILVDDPEREDEGDLIVAAEKVTPEIMNFMIRQGTGIVCLSMTEQLMEKFNLPLMVPAKDNTSFRGTPFTLSVDAKDHITTGVSADDRAKTIEVMMADDATANDIVKPGHIFPLQAKAGGVLEREGHTEGSVDLAALAGFKPAAVLCEIMNPDGRMARGASLKAFAEKHQLLMLSIADILAYRYFKENMIDDIATSQLSLENYGVFNFSVLKEKYTGHEHVALIKEQIHTDKPVLVRVHSSCVTGDLFGSERCDCHKQLHYSLKQISKEGGFLIYLKQEGRGIGLFNKIKAYALQENGYDTVQANEALGLPIDSRQYYMAAHILKKFGVNDIRLLTNNPQKVADLKNFGMHQVTRETMPSFSCAFNEFYLQTKKIKLNHAIEFNLLS